MVNQIETARTSASIVTLTRIAIGLGVPLAELFVNGSVPVPVEREPKLATVVKGDQRKRLQFPKSHVVYELLTPDLRWPFEFLWVQLEPDHSPLELRSHAGQECAVVIAGKMRVEIGDEEYELETGDSISFDSGIPHRIQNMGGETLIQLSVICPPSF